MYIVFGLILIILLWFFVIYPRFPNKLCVKSYSRISFNSFISFYNIKPSRWVIVNTDIGLIKYYTGEAKEIYFAMATYRDIKLLKRFLKDRKRRQEELKQAEDLSFLLEQSKKDISNFQKEAQTQSQKTYNEILQRLSNK